MFGYIYVRQHPAYDIYNACKLGKTMQIPERDSQYATGEIIRGKFTLVILLEYTNISLIEKMLQNYFKCLGHHIMYDGGTEFFNIAIIELIVPYLQLTVVKFRVLSDQEIHELSRQERIKSLCDLCINKMKLNIPSRIIPPNLDTSISNIYQEILVPRPYQEDIIADALKYYETNTAGILNLICGTGKTLISLWIAERLSCKKILIGVPNKLLLKQWAQIAKKIFKCDIILIYDIDIDGDYIITNDAFILITTYASAYKIAAMDIIFDMKILDEAHHLTGLDIKEKSYLQIMNIPAKKQIGLTATIKHISGLHAISNDSISHFGTIIASRNLHWAIKNEVICDYELLIMRLRECDVMPTFATIDERRIKFSMCGFCAFLYKNIYYLRQVQHSYLIFLE